MQTLFPWAFVIYTTVHIHHQRSPIFLGEVVPFALHILKGDFGRLSAPARLASNVAEVATMKIQVVVTRTDTGATTKLMSNSGESSKNYASWNEALKEAEDFKLINTVEATAAKALPPGLPLHTTTEMDAGNLANAGFTPGKTSPPQ
jgi:hypothetical protein